MKITEANNCCLASALLPSGFEINGYGSVQRTVTSSVKNAAPTVQNVQNTGSSLKLIKLKFYFGCFKKNIEEYHVFPYRKQMIEKLLASFKDIKSLQPPEKKQKIDDVRGDKIPK